MMSKIVNNKLILTLGGAIVALTFGATVIALPAAKQFGLIALLMFAFIRLFVRFMQEKKSVDCTEVHKLMNSESAAERVGRSWQTLNPSKKTE